MAISNVSKLRYVNKDGSVDFDKVMAADFKEYGYLYDYITKLTKETDVIVYVHKLLAKAKECGCIAIARELAELKKKEAISIIRDDEEHTIFTIEYLENYLSSRSIEVRYNEISHAVEISGSIDGYNQEQLVEQLPAILFSELKEIGVNSGGLLIIAEYLSIIAGKNCYNPIAEMLRNVTWDGLDRISVLLEIMRIDITDTLSATLITKWLCQCIALSLYNNQQRLLGAEGVLTLVGRQGVGKTTLCRKLGVNNKLCRTGLVLDPHNKDDIIKGTECFIGELGEIESTFKREISALKAFLTEHKDIIRRPYGRTFIEHPRRTSYIATCNTSDFLVDHSGNRRFFTIPCNNDFDLSKLESLDVIQLWAQVKQKVDKEGFSCFRLNKEEQSELEKRNSGHLRELRGQSEVQDILDKARSDPNTFEFVNMTVTEFKSMYASLRFYTNAEIGKALSHLGIESFQGRRRGSKSSERLRKLPRAKNLTIFRKGDGEKL